VDRALRQSELARELADAEPPAAGQQAQDRGRSLDGLDVPRHWRNPNPNSV
jgi:hypothetical protein